VYMFFTEFGPVAGIVSIVVLVFVMPAYVWLAVKYLPQTAIGRVLQLAARRRDPGEGTPDADEQKAHLGRTGVAETPLRPSGAIRVGKERVIATAETGFIEKGATVKVIKAVGMNVVVRKSDQPS
jgi:membrane-bound serine protease (ClpP class)